MIERVVELLVQNIGWWNFERHNVSFQKIFQVQDRIYKFQEGFFSLFSLRLNNSPTSQESLMIFSQFFVWNEAWLELFDRATVSKSKELIRILPFLRLPQLNQEVIHSFSFLCDNKNRSIMRIPHAPVIKQNLHKRRDQFALARF